MAELKFLAAHGADIAPHLDALADLRISVFRAFPYLYDGDPEYEREYLQTYVECSRSLAFLVYDDTRLIGGTTALPLEAGEAAFRKPLAAAGFDPKRMFYFGESLLRPAYRGRGLGHRFFDEREAWAKRCGDFSHACFCAVQRPSDHPEKPADYRALDTFWHSRGYRRFDDIVAEYDWQDIDRDVETTKQLVFWIRALEED